MLLNGTVCKLNTSIKYFDIIQLNFVNTDSDNTDSWFKRTIFFGPARSPWFYIQLLMDNIDSANADF